MFNNIKSNFILDIVFKKYLKGKNYLTIIKHNKRLQKRLNISLEDYKTFKKIEIDITPIKELEDPNEKYIFININEKDRKYYHIYFNSNLKEEINRTYITNSDNIQKIKIVIDEEVNSLSELFNNCSCLQSINFTKFNRYNITNMTKIFRECDELINLNISELITNNVENMSYMFNACNKLKELNLSNFDTSNVKNMRFMFSGCSSLVELNLKNFKTKNVTNMSNMFSGCYSLKKLNISSFDTSNVTHMNEMFFNCKSLINLDIRNLNITSKCITTNIFAFCSEELWEQIKSQNNNLEYKPFEEYY